MTLKNRGIIAAGHQKTAQAGVEMFALGGNAFDAAIAAVLAAFVVESPLTSAGGGGFLLAHSPDQGNILYDFFSQTPQSKNLHSQLSFAPVNVDFGGEIQVFQIGLGSMAVPSNLAGIFQVHQELGRLPLNVVAEPAIQYARDGFIVNQFNDFCFKLLEPILTNSAAGKKIYSPQGKLLGLGETCQMLDFANILTYLVEKGVTEFYQGEIAHQLVKDCRDQGGYLTIDDLINYQVIKRNPLKINYRGHEFLTNTPPSSGGALIAFSLKLLETINFDNFSFGSREHLAVLARIMSLTNEARKDGYDNQIYESNIADIFLDFSHVNVYKNRLNKWGSTTHISVLDQEGNAASITTSNGEGSGYIIPDTGIMINNMLGEADLNPLGFQQWPCNQRISSMMSPTMILKDNQPEIVLGSGGSNRIRTAIFQVISNLIDFNLPIKEAVENPRVHWENNVFSIEPPYRLNELSDLKLSDATELIFWPNQSLFFGGVNAVRITPEGVMEGAGDPRREGVVICG
jgi:gamma-glutamyltranspeptidase/glutathione hydrolase